MTSLIKAETARHTVRQLAATAFAAEPPATSRSPLQHALDDAHETIARLQHEMSQSRHMSETDRAAAYETGKVDGRREADDGAKQRLAYLETASEAALAAWERRLADADLLAVQLARATLAKVFADSADLGDLVARAISRKIAAVREASVVSIVVSKTDFSEPSDRDALAQRVPPARGRIVVDDTLKSGGCRIDLDLGHIDLGVETLAGEIDAALAALVAGRAGA